LISAKLENGMPVNVKVVSEKGGELKIRLPFETMVDKKIRRKGEMLVIPFKKGQSTVFTNVQLSASNRQR
jgi:hypothetical protein